MRATGPSGWQGRGLLQWLPESERFQPVPVRRRPRSMHCTWAPMARSGCLKMVACRATAGARAGWSGRPWSVQSRATRRSPPRGWWSMRRGCVGNQCAWPGAHRGRRPECAPVWRARWPAEPGIPRTHAGDVGRRSSGGRYTGRCGGVRPEAGTSVDAACAAGDRAGGGAPQRAGAGPTHDAPLQIADGDRDLRIVARLLSFADSASNTYRYRLAGYDPDWVEVGPAGALVLAAGTGQLSAGSAGAVGRPCLVTCAEPGISACSHRGGAACPAC